MATLTYLWRQPELSENSMWTDRRRSKEEGQDSRLSQTRESAVHSLCSFLLLRALEIQYVLPYSKELLPVLRSREMRRIKNQNRETLTRDAASDAGERRKWRL